MPVRVYTHARHTTFSQLKLIKENVPAGTLARWLDVENWFPKKGRSKDCQFRMMERLKYIVELVGA